MAEHRRLSLRESSAKMVIQVDDIFLRIVCKYVRAASKIAGVFHFLKRRFCSLLSRSERRLLRLWSSQ